MRLRLLTMVLLAGGALAMAPIASAYESFTATLLGTSYNASTGSVNVSVATRYSNTACT